MSIYLSFASRAEAAGQRVDPGVTEFRAGGMAYVADAGGTALKTADGRTWSPVGTATYEHWGAVGDNVKDDTVAIRATHDWCMRNDTPLQPLGRTYKVTDTIIDYDVARDGTDLSLTLRGDGMNRTVFNVAANLEEPLIKITGDTSAYGASHAKGWNFEDIGIRSNGIASVDVFSITAVGQINFEQVSVFNCRGTAITAREWWDSTVDIRIVRCGDNRGAPSAAATAGAEAGDLRKEAVILDYYFADNIENSACNNLWFPTSFQIEASRYTGMYWGPGTRKCTLNGKIHGNPRDVVDAPHLVLDGARSNDIIGANLTVAGGSAIEILNTRGFLASDNVILGNSIHSLGDSAIRIVEGERNIISYNAFHSNTTGILVEHGAENIVSANVFSGQAVQVRIGDLAAVGAVGFAEASGVGHILDMREDGRIVFDGVTLGRPTQSAPAQDAAIAAIGGTRNDLLVGVRAADFLHGGSGDDRLVGGPGGDVLSGGSGRDRMVGGTGTDIFFGGSGADSFVFFTTGEVTEAGAGDRIVDFRPGEDRLVLSPIDADTTRGGHQTFDWLDPSGQAAFGRVPGQLFLSDRSPGMMVLYGNTDRDRDYEIRLVLPDAVGLSADDFIF